MDVQDIIDMIQVWDDIRKLEFYKLYNNEKKFKELKTLVFLIEEIKGERDDS